MLTGSLETFSSAEVLRLVAGTRKTGSLVVRGDGPFGAVIEVDVRVSNGEITTVTGGSPLASDTHTALADLLRIGHGEFSFDADAIATTASGPAIDVEDAIAEAESILAEWKLLEAYVPSLDAAVELSASIDHAVTVEPRQWTTLSAIGTGCTVRDLARITGEGPLEACRDIRALVDLGVVRVLAGHDAAEISSDDADEFATGDLDLDEGSWTAAFGDEDSDRPSGPELEPVPVFDAADLPLGPDSADLVPAPEVDVPAVSERFRHFSPRAAVAMAATELGGAHLADPGDETVSRNVLLKFLASARQSA